MTDHPAMRALSQDELGGPDVLHVVELPRPKARPNEILVRIHAASVNPTDWKHRATGGFLGRPPFVLGWDLSGVVEAVGIGVARFRVGDEVMGMLSYPFGHGAHAEYVAAPARWFVPKPAGLDHVHAAALPLVSLTAWQALFENADLRPGQRVLVHAAAGGVGHVAVQLAKARGAHVIGTASEANHDFLRRIGVDEPVDYRTTDFAEVVQEVDVVLDTIGGDYSVRSLRVLRPGGVVVSLRPTGPDDFPTEAERRGVRAVRMLVDASHAHLEAITELVEDGRLAPTIARVFSLAEGAQAHRLGEAGHTVGKLVLEIGPAAAAE